MYSTGPVQQSQIAGTDPRLQEFLNRAEYHAKIQADQQAAKEDQKLRERKQKEAETKAYLDAQVAAKQERKEIDRA